MSNKPEKTRAVNVRMPLGVYQKISEDLDIHGDHRTVTEFILDATKWYLDYRMNQRIELAKLEDVKD